MRTLYPMFVLDTCIFNLNTNIAPAGDTEYSDGENEYDENSDEESECQYCTIKIQPFCYVTHVETWADSILDGEVPPGNAGFGEQSAKKNLIEIRKLEAQPLGEPENSDDESLGSFFYNEYDSDEEDRGN